MVFKTDRIVCVRPGDLDSTRQLWNGFNRLTGSSAYRPPLAPLTGTGSDLSGVGNY